MPLDSPPWSNSDSDANACGDDVQTPPSPGHEGGWQAFIAELAERYGAEANGLIAIEAWNEPNLGHFWGVPEGEPFTPQPPRFARLVNKASSQVNAVAPQIRVFPGGISPSGRTPNQFMRDATDPSASVRINPGPIDALSFHLYAFDTPNDKVKNDKEAREDIRAYYDQMVDGLRDAFADKNRWITEIGFPSVSTPDLERASLRSQRRRLLHAYFKYARLPRVTSFIVHRLIDFPSPEPARLGLLRETAGFPVKVPAGQPAISSAYCRLADRLNQPSDPVDPSRC